MASDSDFLVILVLGAIAAFLIYRLVATLGQNTGFQQPLSKDSLGAMAGASQDKPEMGEVIEAVAVVEEDIPQHLREGVDKIRNYEPMFSLKDFEEGALSAYEMIVQAFAEGDLETLNHLLDKSVLNDFKAAILERQKQEMTLLTTVVRIVSVTVEQIEISAAKALATVHFVTEQTHVLKNKAGEIEEGSDTQIEEVSDIWTFSKNLKSSSPNWLLVDTGA